MVSSLLSVSILFAAGLISADQGQWNAVVPLEFNSAQFTVSVGGDTIYSELFSPASAYSEKFLNEPIFEHFSNYEDEDISFGLKIYTRDRVPVNAITLGYVLLNGPRLVDYFQHPTLQETIILYALYRVPICLAQRVLYLTPPGNETVFYKIGKESDFGLFLPGSTIDYLDYGTRRGTLTNLGDGTGRLLFDYGTEVYGTVPEPSILLLFAIGTIFICGDRKKWSK